MYSPTDIYEFFLAISVFLDIHMKKRIIEKI